MISNRWGMAQAGIPVWSTVQKEERAAADGEWQRQSFLFRPQRSNNLFYCKQRFEILLASFQRKQWHDVACRMGLLHARQEVYSPAPGPLPGAPWVDAQRVERHGQGGQAAVRRLVLQHGRHGMQQDVALGKQDESAGRRAGHQQEHNGNGACHMSCSAMPTAVRHMSGHAHAHAMLCHFVGRSTAPPQRTQLASLIGTAAQAQHACAAQQAGSSHDTRAVCLTHVQACK